MQPQDTFILHHVNELFGNLALLTNWRLRVAKRLLNRYSIRIVQPYVTAVQQTRWKCLHLLQAKAGLGEGRQYLLCSKSTILTTQTARNSQPIDYSPQTASVLLITIAIILSQEDVYWSIDQAFCHGLILPGRRPLQLITSWIIFGLQESTRVPENLGAKNKASSSSFPRHQGMQSLHVYPWRGPNL